MSDSGRITFQQLCDLADLDVLGLLDEVDQSAFERGFNGSTPLEQDQLRERQAHLVTRLVGELGIEASEAPSEELRQRIHESIRAENARLEASLAPLAHIGRRRRERTHRSGTSNHANGSSGAGQAMRLQQAVRSATIWRAASFGLMAGLLATLIAGVVISKDAQEANRLASQQSASEQLKERYNVDLEALLNVGPGQYVLGLASEQLAKGGLTVRLDTSENTVELVVFGLKPGDYFLECTFKDEPMKIPFRLDNRATVVTLSDIPDRLAETLATSNWTIIDQDNFTIATCNPKIAT